MSVNTTLVATVSGHVQGVGFRAWVRHIARAKGLRGYVRNLPDGTVQVVAHGEEPLLRELVKLLGHGPAGASVSDINVQWLQDRDDNLSEGFEIRG